MCLMLKGFPQISSWILTCHTVFLPLPTEFQCRMPQDTVTSHIMTILAPLGPDAELALEWVVVVFLETFHTRG